MAVRGVTRAVPLLCAAILAAGPGYAEEVAPGLANAAEKARSRLVAASEIVAAPVRPARLTPRRVRLIRVAPAGSVVQAGGTMMQPTANVEQRLNAAFDLVRPVEIFAGQPDGTPRLPSPRPAPSDEMGALAYADSGKAAGDGSGLTAIEALVEEHAAANDIPPALAHALVQVESSYNPKARGSNGEIGLMQIKPQTARRMGYDGSAKGLYDPETNLAVGMKYLGKAHARADGDTCGTLLRYNAGLDAKRKSAASNKFCAKVKKVMAKRA